MSDSGIETENSSVRSYEDDDDDETEEEPTVHSKHTVVRRHFLSDITYKSPSDAKIASLFLWNACPADVFAKIFDVIQDSTFKLEEVSFKNLQDVFKYVSAHRGPDRDTRTAEDASTTQASASEKGVSSDVLRLVVERMMKDQLPLGVAAMEQRWEDAYNMHVSDFHAMCLVHRSWTPLSRSALRRRAVVPFNKMDRFLLSPLCGSWVEEMILYWDVNTGDIGVTMSDIALFEALLKRVPALRSLSFNTRHVWPKEDLVYGGMWEGDDEQPPLRVDKCLELMADLLPNLENLYLKHFRGVLRTEEIVKGNCLVTIDRTLQYCPEIPSLLRQLPKMHSLKLLSTRYWTCKQKLTWEGAPAPALKTIELANLDKEAISYKWVLESKEEFKPTALSIDFRDYKPKYQDIAAISSGLEKLQIYSDDSASTSAILSKMEKLTRLDLLLGTASSENFLEDIELPANLEYLGIHFHGQLWYYLESIVKIFQKRLKTVRRLRTLVLTTAPSSFPLSQAVSGEMDGFLFHMSLPYDRSHDENFIKLTKICKKRGVRVIVGRATCTPNCDRNFLRHGEPKPDKDPQEENMRLGFAMADILYGTKSSQWL